MNDFMRDKTTDENGEIPLWAEIMAGGCVSNFLLFLRPFNKNCLSSLNLTIFGGEGL
jgi:hypothetical protein